MQILYLLSILVPLAILIVLAFNNPERKSTKFAQRAYLTVIFIFLYIPILVLMVFSFNSARSSGVWEGFSLKWYVELFKDEKILTALYNTLLVAFVSAIVATVLGTLGAIGIHYMHRLPKKVIMNITYLPVLNADIITGISLLLLFNMIHIPRGLFSLMIAHICFNTPYVILSVLPKLKQMDNALYEAALDLGASPFTAMKKVILPEIMPGIVSGFLMAVTLSVDDFVISFFTRGSVVSTLSIEVYSMTKRGVTPKINALSTILFLVVFTVLLTVNLRKKRTPKKQQEQPRR